MLDIRQKMPDGSFEQVAQFIMASPYNSEETITESGEWTVPVSGWYEITIINGGDGAVSPEAISYGDPGNSGAKETFLQFLQKGQVVSISVGAKGLGNTSFINTDTTFKGGKTYFGTLTPDENKCFINKVVLASGNSQVTNCQLSGAGEGGGRASAWNKEENGGAYYGAGGSIVVAPTNGKYCGDGYQGAVILRWHDPNK